MKIEVGMYVRLKADNGTCIRQIIEICEDKRYATYRVDKPFCNQTGLSPKKIIKASHNIIDLIEVGDYVNGILVSDITGEYLRIDGESHNKYYFSKEIKSILTHEQFEREAYKV